MRKGFHGNRKRSVIGGVVILTVFCLFGCGSGAGNGAGTESVKEYKSKSGMYSFSLPGKWTLNDNGGMSGMQDMISLSGENGISALTLGVGKDDEQSQYGNDVKNLDDFQEYIVNMFLNGPSATTELQEAEAIPLKGMLEYRAEEGVMTQADGNKGNLYVEYAESKKSYYVIMFSGGEDFFDKIEAVKEGAAIKELGVEAVKADIPDSLKWMNATYAVLTKTNGGDITLPGGFEKNEVMGKVVKQMLERDWGITDRSQAEEQITWLMEEGHNRDALEYLAELGADGMERETLLEDMEEKGYTAEQKTVLLAAYDAKVSYGEDAIAGWDQSRAMSLLGYYYVADLYTYGEAMEQSLEIAGQIQQTYSSWDDFMKSYFYGYAYWCGEGLEDPNSQADKRQKLYQEMKEEEGGIFSVDWNLELGVAEIIAAHGD